ISRGWPRRRRGGSGASASPSDSRRRPADGPPRGAGAALGLRPGRDDPLGRPGGPVGGHRRPPGAERRRQDHAAQDDRRPRRRRPQPAGTLSGGEQQMLALARAFVTDAPLILADELSMGLAPVVVDQIFAAVGVLRNEGRSVLLVEQYVERAVAVADYVYILNKGRIVFTGLPAECSTNAVFARYLQGAA